MFRTSTNSIPVPSFTPYISKLSSVPNYRYAVRGFGNELASDLDRDAEHRLWYEPGKQWLLEDAAGTLFDPIQYPSRFS